MPPHPNLVCESLLVNETIALLRAFGGRASAVKVVDRVMNIRRAEPDFAKTLVMDLVDRDPRLQFAESGHLEFVPIAFETRRLAETDFVVFDLETTGAKAPPCRVTEIGAYKVRGGRIVDEFHTLINPEMPIPPFIAALTGISNQMVRYAPKFAEVGPQFMEFIGDAVLVAHNAVFDMRFLNHEISRIYDEYRVANPCLCTVQLSRKLLPEIANHKLKTVAEHYNVRLDNHHRAKDDARATAEIFLNLIDLLDGYGVDDFGGIRRLGVKRFVYAK
ncbi:MAG: PolC-type DNA polymerase III [Pyrinomonadaceae bacterium]